MLRFRLIVETSSNEYKVTDKSFKRAVSNSYSKVTIKAPHYYAFVHNFIMVMSLLLPINGIRATLVDESMKYILSFTFYKKKG